MPTWLISLKGKIVAIAGTIIGVLLLYISALKRTALKKELKQQKATSKAKDASNDALVKGISDENKRTTTRGYFNNNSGD